LTAEPHPAGPLFTLHAEAFGQVMRVWFMGELSETTAPECVLDLRDPLAGREPIVVIDVGGLTSVDDFGVEALRAIKADLESRGRRLLLSSVSNGTAKTLPPNVSASFDVLDGGARADAHCDLCDRPLPSDLHLCQHCGALL
jgi:anti-anti-sigma regulatory factor